MADWSSSMQQTFEFYVVDPATWGDVSLIDTVKSCSITHDMDSETISSASIDTTEELDECYIRVYLVTIQNGITEKFPMGVYLVQTPGTKFNGRVSEVTLDAYSPLLELKEKMPAIGYALPKNSNVLTVATNLVEENVRAPVVGGKSSDKLASDFVAESDENLLEFITALLANANYGFALDARGRILFAPKQEVTALKPVWTYTDDNSSILYPELEVSRDLYGIPNVVEVVYSKDNRTLYSKVTNKDRHSPISTVNRGREIVHRVTNPDMAGEPTSDYLKSYATQLLKDLSSVEYTLTYTHGYCPVRVGDCVRLEYNKAGLDGVNAKVIRQNIKCEPGCPVEETAIYTRNLWE